jgi:hypothetical protein
MRPLTLRIPGWLVLVAWVMLSDTFAAGGAREQLCELCLESQLHTSAPPALLWTVSTH